MFRTKDTGSETIFFCCVKCLFHWISPTWYIWWLKSTTTTQSAFRQNTDSDQLNRQSHSIQMSHLMVFSLAYLLSQSVLYFKIVSWSVLLLERCGLYFIYLSGWKSSARMACQSHTTNKSSHFALFLCVCLLLLVLLLLFLLSLNVQRSTQSKVMHKIY